MSIIKENIDALYDMWWNILGYRLRNFYRSIANVIRWLPTIWKDRDWDDSFILTILQTKLRFQSEYLAKNSQHYYVGNDVYYMNVCIKLIEAIKEEVYVSEYSDYHDTEYYFVDSDKKGLSIMKHNRKSEKFNDYFLKYPLIYKKVMKGEGWVDINRFEEDDFEYRHSIAMNIAHINSARAKDLLYKILRDKLSSWWD